MKRKNTVVQVGAVCLRAARRSDKELSLRVIYISSVVHLNPFDIQVDVKQGMVNLSGTVESYVDRDLAEELARGAGGVKDVINLIEVDDALTRPSKRERGFADYVNDANVTAKVKSRLLWPDRGIIA